MIIFIYLLSFIFCVNSKTTLWKLNEDQTKVVQAIDLNKEPSKNILAEDDPVFNIIISTVHFGKTWIKYPSETKCSSCKNVQNQNTLLKKLNDLNSLNESSTNVIEESFECEPSVNFTFYDNLVGVIHRNNHPNITEPHPDLILTKRNNAKKENLQIEISAMERKLKKAIQEKPKSVHLYNQIGNFWRLKGNTKKAIECFRKALSMCPHNADVLLNLARVLYTLQYLDDAIYLTRKSLDVHPSDKKAWQQYFTLGEIFKAYGHYPEASIHLKHTLGLKPGFVPAVQALKEIEDMPSTTIHLYTLVIIICLVLGVLLIILSSTDSNEDECEVKHQRHFNKAMAMRSLRGFGISHRKFKRN